jgi:hypothetical protein
LLGERDNAPEHGRTRRIFDVIKITIPLAKCKRFCIELLTVLALFGAAVLS